MVSVLLAAPRLWCRTQALASYQSDGDAGRIEFSQFLPANTSSVIIAPIGKNGVLIAGGDTQRGFSKVDQAWISSIADKLDDTLEHDAPKGTAKARRLAK